MNDCKKYKPLIAGLIDHELTTDEINELNRHLNRCEACRQEFDELSAISDKFDIPPFKEPEDKVLNDLWKMPYSRLSRKFGLLLVFGGIVFLVGYGFYALMVYNKVPAAIRIPYAAIIIGFIILLISVISDRIKTYKTDQYKEVKR